MRPTVAAVLLAEPQLDAAMGQRLVASERLAQLQRVEAWKLAFEHFVPGHAYLKGQ